ncbi:MAG: hypothetical protein K6F23_13650 [Solobacterium sp.]|nr:hypothetical protein [Solobacterium sp.]
MDGGGEEIKDADIIIIKLESQVKITDDVYGDSTLGWLLSPEENGWGDYLCSVTLTSGYFSDWPKTLFGEDTVGMYRLTLKDTVSGEETAYYIRVGE